MIEKLRHRGPDSSGMHLEPQDALCLGHTRLSILDHHGGSQPMSTADGALTVVFNGELYNHADLRHELQQRGCVFRSHHADTEVLLHGYREWGLPDLCQRLNGMWAFAMYDRCRRRLLLSRDRFGQKPLYYHAAGGCFAFASELTALLECPEVPRRLSWVALQKYLAYGFIPAPHCLYDGIWKLPGGHNLILDLPSMRHDLRRYWRFVPEPGDPLDPKSEKTMALEVRHRLDQAVRRHLVADVPVGVFLSGGIDSSAITALAARTLPAGALRTFSVGFAEPSFDESAYADLVARHCGTTHHALRLSLNEVRNTLGHVIAGLDEPLGDSSFLPTWHVCRETRKQVTVALGGDGGDELFAGYDPFRALYWAEWYHSLVPRPLHAAVRLAAAALPVSRRNMSLGFRLKRLLRGLSYPPALWNPLWLSPLAPGDLADLLNQPCEPEAIYQEAIEAWEGCPAPDPVSRTTCFFVQLYLQDDILTKIDRAGMLHSLEVRSPFLDQEVVELARRLPLTAKLRGGRTKVLFREAVNSLLPAAVLRRPKKGFGVPLESWFRDWNFDLRDLPPILNQRAIEGYIDRHRRGRDNHKHVLWDLLLLNEHLRQHSTRQPRN